MILITSFLHKRSGVITVQWLKEVFKWSGHIYKGVGLNFYNKKYLYMYDCY
jgi:hypothetical protein